MKSKALTTLMLVAIAALASAAIVTPYAAYTNGYGPPQHMTRGMHGNYGNTMDHGGNHGDTMEEMCEGHHNMTMHGNHHNTTMHEEHHNMTMGEMHEKHHNTTMRGEEDHHGGPRHGCH